jgi:hypothetical protein
MDSFRFACMHGCFIFCRMLEMLSRLINKSNVPPNGELGAGRTAISMYPRYCALWVTPMPAGCADTVKMPRFALGRLEVFGRPSVQ